MRASVLVFFAVLFTFHWQSSTLNPELDESFALKLSAASPLVKAINVHEAAALVSTTRPEARPQSGFLPLIMGSDAFEARVALIESAVTSLDLQYYIWHRDRTGMALWSKVLNAAERGVRVRLLLDDMNLGKDRSFLAQLDRHPNIEIRLYNPTSSDGTGLGAIGRNLQIIFDFDQMNHRMHNKVLVADESFAIVGGRNIGDEYFDLKRDKNFRDLDMLAAGKVCKEFSREFDAFWSSAVTFGLKEDGNVLATARSDEWAAIRKTLNLEQKSKVTTVLLNQPKPGAAPVTVGSLSKQLIWAPAKAVFDSPQGDAQKKQLEDELRKVPEAKREFLIESAYFIPPKNFLKQVGNLSKKGVKVRILTNSLMSNDVLIAHAGYSNKREAVLSSGAELYEWRNSFVKVETVKREGVYASRAGLHSKTFVVDRRYLFVGSMNLDPRSIRLNTESGLLIESPELADEVGRFIEDGMSPKTSWKVTMTCKERPCQTGEKSDGLQWTGERDGSLQTLRQEPDASFWKRFLTNGLSLLPIEDKL
ncbi:MAG: phospholipase D family protein [Chitinophagaceae bacterium]|nr:phospholipase D family protein [Oligoflexus sp.]